MPRGRFAEEAIRRLNTRVGLLDSVHLWGVALLLITLSIAGKGLACLAAARVAGEPWRESLAIGILMNTRGLMELTTLMASPLFELVYGRGRATMPAGERSVT